MCLIWGPLQPPLVAAACAEVERAGPLRVAMVLVRLAVEVVGRVVLGHLDLLERDVDPLVVAIDVAREVDVDAAGDGCFVALVLQIRRSWN